MGIISLETDYLVLGSGAMGIAFADEIISRTRNQHVTLVDRYAHPGGHWNTAYSFVRLHQPSSAYGVNSEKLEKPWSAFASKTEILS